MNIKESLIFLLGTILGIIGTALVITLKDKIKELMSHLIDYFFEKIGGEFENKRFEKKYLKYINFQHRYIKIIGSLGKYIRNPKIKDVYISLDLYSTPDYSNENEMQDYKNIRNKSISIFDAATRIDKLVILGEPGAGKTTSLDYLAYNLSSSQKTSKKEMKSHIPIYIPLRRCINSKGILDALLDLNISIIPNDLLKECPSEYFYDCIKKGRCLFLLDGMDEVHNEDEHRHLAKMINDLVSTYPDNKYVVTCRIASWMNLLSPDFTLTYIRPFNWNDVKKFIGSWHLAIMTAKALELFNDNDEGQKKALEEAAHEANKKSRKLISALHKNDRIAALSSSPIMLSLICLVHYERGDLPQGRSRLYEECIKILLDIWDKSDKELHLDNILGLEKKELILQNIAFQLFLEGESEVDRDKAIRITSEILQKNNYSFDPDILLKHIEQRSGILVERSIDILSFSHLTFQEYLIAEFILSTPSESKLIMSKIFDDNWREVVALYIGMLSNASNLLRSIFSKADSPEKIITTAYFLSETSSVDHQIRKEIIEQLITIRDTTKKEEMKDNAKKILRNLGLKEVSFGKFDIGLEINRGGFGVIYEAYDIKDEIEVALKVFFRDLEEYSSVIENTKNVGKILSKINHPGLVKIYEIEEIDRELYVSMELLMDDSLQSIKTQLSKGGMYEGIPSFEDEEKRIMWVCSLIIKIADAVDCLHRNNILHLDLSPGNIILEKGEPKIIDFGLISFDDKNINKNFIYGTPAFISPEMIKNGLDAADERSDIFSLGMIALFLFASHSEIIYSISPTRTVIRGSMRYEEEYFKPLWGKKGGIGSYWQLEKYLKEKGYSADSLQTINMDDILFKKTGHSAIKSSLNTIPIELRDIFKIAIEELPEKRYNSIKHFKSDIEKFIRGERIDFKRKTLFNRIKDSFHV